jgi:hypothetical protein
MMAMVEKLGGNWVIVRGHDTDAPDEVNNSPQDAESPAIREFWTGGAWAGQYGLARRFATKEEAEAHLAEHRHEMT